MSSNSHTIISAIQNIAGNHIDEVSLIEAEINSVNLDDRTANVTTISGKESSTYDVNLQAVNGDGVIFIPSIESTVYVLSSKYTTPFIVQYSDIDTIYFTLLNIEISAKTNINGSNFGGLIIIQDLVNKINTLENKVNELQTWGASLSPSSVVPFPTVKIITPTQVVDIENNTVNHGNTA